MTYYHLSKQAALDAGDVFKDYFSVRASLEPNNGWVIVLQPLDNRFLDFPLAPILKKAEIDINRTLRQRPPEFKRTQPLPAKESSRRRSSAPPKAPPPPPPPPPPAG